MPPAAYGELDAGLPIVMLPVRLETRYFDIDPATVELRVRIFPSAAHVTTTRPGIDPAERDETIAYWRTRKATGEDSAATSAAWQRMVQLFGDPRAQYLRRILTPSAGAGGALVFPDVPLNPPDDGAILTSEATALPTRFFVAGYEGAARRFLVPGQTVPASVAVGPHGDSQAVAWQSDFAAAESIGLAVRTRMTREQAPLLTRLLAFGVREGPDAAGSAAALETLLERHSREDGVAMLSAGTPTNHTPGARVAPPAPASGTAPAEGTDGARLASALGLDASSFAPVSGTEPVTEPAVEAMHTAIWPATLGYFLDEVMAPLVSDAAIGHGRTLFEKFVRPRGPFPSLALGGQPHGILPVSSLAGWRTAQAAEDPFAKLLNTLRADWLTASANVPRLGSGADAGADLAVVLSQSPFSTRWVGRTLQSHVVAQSSFSSFPGFDPGQFETIRDQLRRAVLAAELAPLGLTGEPRALDFIFAASSFGLNAALVAPSDAPRTAPLPVDYIGAIAAATVDPLKNHAVAGATPRTLLYLLLRHATLLVMARAADRFDIVAQPVVKEMVFIESPANTVWNRLEKPVSALGNKTLTQVFAGPLPIHANLVELARHRQALQVLSKIPVGELERLTAEAIDASSHRLDAWITALATERLGAMRGEKPRGSHLGAYAWVDAPPLPAVLPRDGEPPAPDPDSDGFLHAPGLAHARTAAILRAAFLARHQEAAQAPLAVDLSSDRVRDARHLLEGVRNGASLAALLGERLERWMVEQNFGPKLPDVRGQFALVDGSGRKRIDGLKAAQAWSAAPPADLLPVARLLAAVTDAIADLLLAEAVHQQASGNPGRAQPALAALDTGVTLPAEFDVVRTEANSTAHTWRFVLPLAPEALEKWVAGMIGDPAGLTATVAREGAAPMTLSLKQIEITAQGLLDFVKTGPDAPALAARFVEKAGGGSATFSPGLATALTAAFAVDRLLRGARPLQEADIGASRDPLPGFDRRSLQKEWLHDLARVRPSLDALDTLDFLLRGAGGDLGLRFLTVGPGLNVVSVGDLPAGPAAGLLLDGWSETTPGLDATTGIAMHYDAPRARAPQAILLVVPPDPASGWGIDSVEASLTETADLTRIRMVRPSDVHGSFLPALYFADNLAAETIAIDFLSMGIVAQFVQADN
jgi:hypothetical protein